MREIGMAGIGEIKGRMDWPPSARDEKDFREERDRDGRDRRDERDSWQPSARDEKPPRTEMRPSSRLARFMWTCGSVFLYLGAPLRAALAATGI